MASTPPLRLLTLAEAVRGDLEETEDQVQTRNKSNALERNLRTWAPTWFSDPGPPSRLEGSIELSDPDELARAPTRTRTPPNNPHNDQSTPEAATTNKQLPPSGVTKTADKNRKSAFSGLRFHISRMTPFWTKKPHKDTKPLPFLGLETNEHPRPSWKQASSQLTTLNCAGSSSAHPSRSSATPPPAPIEGEGVQNRFLSLLSTSQVSTVLNVRTAPSSIPSLPKYEYPELKPGEIRMMTLMPGSGNDPLRCSLSIEGLNQRALNKRKYMPLDYQAVSYAWGSSNRSNTILCSTTENMILDTPAGYVCAQSIFMGSDDGLDLQRYKSLPITESLRVLLLQIRDSKEMRCLWVDSLCINQDDLAERENQVQLMSDIYSKASRVLIWLGEEDGQAEGAFDAIRVLARMRMSDNTLSPDIEARWDPTTGFRPWQLPIQDPFFLPREKYTAFEALLRRPWFSRAWTFQEAVQARQAIVQCGSLKVSWDQLYHAVSVAGFLGVAPTLISGETSSYLATLPNIVLAIGSLRQTLEEYRVLNLERLHRQDSQLGVEEITELTDKFDLENLITRIRDQDATDPRDKVYAVLSMSFRDSSLAPRPNYSQPARDLYIKTAKYFMRSWGGAPILDVLSFVQPIASKLPPPWQDRASRRVEGLPSWVPDWTLPLIYPPILHNTRTYATTGREGQVEFLTAPDHVGAASSSCMCLKLRGIPVLKLNEVFDTKLTKYQVGLMNSLPYRYPTTNLTYPEAYAHAVEPQGGNSASFGVPDAHRVQGFWAALKNGGKEDRSAFPQHTKQSFKDHLSAGYLFSHIVFGSPGRGFARGRCFCIASGGFMGLVPASSEPGDVVALLWGAAVPFVIRRQGQHYCLVGECHIFGIMDGEPLEDLDELRVQDFILY